MIALIASALMAANAAADPGLAPLQAALAGGRVQVRSFQAVQAARQAQFTALADPDGWESFPAPDAQTLAWLSGRVPGLNAALVREAPLSVVDGLMTRAAAAKATYLDIFSDPAFSHPKLYYASAATLSAVHAKFVSGAMPIQGTGEDGRPYRIVGVVAGGGRVDILYDRGGFSYQENGKRFKVDGAARVSARGLGPGDIALEGLSTYGAPVFCPWARIQRMTKEAAYKMRVETDCGNRSGNDIRPVIPR